MLDRPTQPTEVDPAAVLPLGRDALKAPDWDAEPAWSTGICTRATCRCTPADSAPSSTGRPAVKIRLSS